MVLQRVAASCSPLAVMLSLTVRSTLGGACPEVQGFEEEGEAPGERSPRATSEWETIAYIVLALGEKVST